MVLGEMKLDTMRSCARLMRNERARAKGLVGWRGLLPQWLGWCSTTIADRSRATWRHARDIGKGVGFGVERERQGPRGAAGDQGEELQGLADHGLAFPCSESMTRMRMPSTSMLRSWARVISICSKWPVASSW